MHLILASTSYITHHVTFYKHHIKKGDVSAEDILNLPEHFRRKCVVLTWMQLGSIAIIMTLATPLMIEDLMKKF